MRHEQSERRGRRRARWSLGAVALGLAALAGCGNTGGARQTSATATTTMPARLISPKTTGAGTTAAGAATTTPGDATTAGATASTTPTAADSSGFAKAVSRPFSDESPWNRVIASASVDRRSAAMISDAQLRLGVQQGSRIEDLTVKRRRITSAIYINTRKWTPPVLNAGAADAVTTSLVCRQPNLPPPNNLCGDGYLVPRLRIPPSSAPYPQYDGWLTVVDAAAGYAYDLWRARRGANGSATMSYLYMRRWNLKGTGYLPPKSPSARGSGMPLFAGIITPADIRAGVIRHALAISVPGPAATNYVQPASVTDGNGRTASLPEGARLRLKSSVSLASVLHKLPGATSRHASAVLFNALRRYGAIVVDRSAVPTLYGQLTSEWLAPLRNARGIATSPDGRTTLPRSERTKRRFQTPLLRGGEVSGLRLSDFEVVSLPPLLKDPPIGAGDTVASLPGSAPQQVPGGTASSSASATASQVQGTGPLTPSHPATPGA
jgi:hypothetical protein